MPHTQWDTPIGEARLNLQQRLADLDHRNAQLLLEIARDTQTPRSSNPSAAPPPPAKNNGSAASPSKASAAPSTAHAPATASESQPRPTKGTRCPSSRPLMVC
jgi:hypothetical protein